MSQLFNGGRVSLLFSAMPPVRDMMVTWIYLVLQRASVCGRRWKAETAPWWALVASSLISPSIEARLGKVSRC